MCLTKNAFCSLGGRRLFAVRWLAGRRQSPCRLALPLVCSSAGGERSSTSACHVCRVVEKECPCTEILEGSGAAVALAVSCQATGEGWDGQVGLVYRACMHPFAAHVGSHKQAQGTAPSATA